MLDFIRDLSKSAEEKRRERITAYVDGQLSAGEKARFEADLKNDPALRAEVVAEERIRTAVRLLQAHQQPVPRNFLLDPAKYGAPKPAYSARAYPALRVATAFAALLFIFTFTFSAFNQGGGVVALTAEEPAAELMMEPMADEPLASAPAADTAMAEEAVMAVVVEETPPAEIESAALAEAEGTVPAMGGAPEIDLTLDASARAAGGTDAGAADSAPKDELPGEESDSFSLQQTAPISPDSVETEMLMAQDSIPPDESTGMSRLTQLAIASAVLLAALLVATLVARSRML